MIGSGTLNPALPLAALTSNFSSMPFKAPPPLGKEMEGISMALDFGAFSCVRAAMPFCCFSGEGSFCCLVTPFGLGVDGFVVKAILCIYF